MELIRPPCDPALPLRQTGPTSLPRCHRSPPFLNVGQFATAACSPARCVGLRASAPAPEPSTPRLGDEVRPVRRKGRARSHGGRIYSMVILSPSHLFCRIQGYKRR